MGSLTTHFVGLCTHIQAPLITGVPHRCVLVNGVIPSNINDHALATHVATLSMQAGDIISSETTLRLPPANESNIVVWQIDGASLKISNSLPIPPNGLNYMPPYFGCIPSLTALTPGLGPLSSSMINDGDQLQASCYFDVDSGTFDAGATLANSAMAVLTSEVSGDSAIITATSFVWGTGTITIKSGAEIHVTNFGVGPNADSSFDFLLQYRVFHSLPSNAGVPNLLGGCVPITAAWGGYPDDAGPGCSNSNYP
jgi:hypothetical protein